jgi:Suppressor of fused protein (SUFU)
MFKRDSVSPGSIRDDEDDDASEDDPSTWKEDGAPVANGQESAEKRWQRVYDARTAVYETKFGKLPTDILKIQAMLGVWPGGGLYAIPAQQLGDGLWLYATFGLTNADMPVKAAAVDAADNTGQQEGDRRPGYGYELLVLTEERASWPLSLLQWAVNAEIAKNADLLSRVEKFDGFAVGKVAIGNDASINVLIAKARVPLVVSMTLPNGRADFLIATVITEEELRWSRQNGCAALLDKLRDAGVGQLSLLDRPSMV